MSGFDSEPSDSGDRENRSVGVRKRRHGVLPFLRWLVLGLASLCYGAGALLHRKVMRRRAAQSGRLTCAVVSVGGLTVGGAGKTPVAARLAWGLHARGWRVVLASRGYKGRHRRSVTVVSDGRYIHTSAVNAGDEAFVLAAHAPGVPVLVGRDRRVVGHRAVSAFDAEILVLDDGFQHHRLARDLDIVCVDGVSGFGNQRLLPAGPLRESIRTLRVADWLCIVDGQSGTASESKGMLPGDEAVKALGSQSHEIIRAKRRPTQLVSLDRADSLSLATLRNRRVGLLSGVARPGSVRRTIEELGAQVIEERRFPDHHPFTERDCAGLDHSSLLWLTTEKDALKILPSWLAGETLWVLRIEVEFEEEERLLDLLTQRLRHLGRLREESPANPESSRQSPSDSVPPNADGF
ncbi:MAG: tetraacyldisaccharide 4'-kinase [Myxococcota bacterium]